MRVLVRSIRFGFGLIPISNFNTVYPINIAQSSSTVNGDCFPVVVDDDDVVLVDVVVVAVVVVAL